MTLPYDLGGNDLIVNSIKTGATTPGSTTTGVNSIGSASVSLVAGTATAAPMTFASGTNLTTPAIGSVEFDGTAFYATSVASSRQMVDTEQYIIQAADSAADSNTGLDASTAAAVFTTSTGAITLVAGKTYFFEGMYMLTNTGTTSHTWGTLFGGTATITAAGSAYYVTGNSATTANTPAAGILTSFVSGAALSSVAVVTAASTSATEQVTAFVKGTVVVNAAGTLIPQMKASARPGASGTPGVVHKAGSYFRIWPAPTLGSVGNWS